MPLSPGVRFGPYEIISAIGAGGMGEVYKAKDTRLNRTVAIKVLPAHLSSNPQLRQRFEREARTISSLSHPNICSLYDIGQQDEVDYLVMEFIEGESLAKRLDRGALPKDQVLRFGIQIAEALDKAHRQGIIHRDLKPGNIMIAKSGAKLLDFGLAKFQANADETDKSTLETRDRPLTEEGVVLGTMQYMAPEQLEGKATDGRTDIFAFGEILYEMITGKPPFHGNSKASLISAILATEPQPITTTQPSLPPALDHLIRKCLAKDPEERWQSARDVGSELKWISEATSSAMTTPQPVTRKRFRERYAWIAAVVVLLAALAAMQLWKKPQAKPELLKLSLLPQEKMRLTGQIAISPNGKYMAYAATDVAGITSVWVRSLDSFTAKALPGTEGSSLALVFWSPDSRYVAYFHNGKLKKSDITEGPPQTLADAPAGRGGSWNKDGVIIYTPNFANTPILRISSDGGTPVEASKLENGQQIHTYPFFLPDGKHFLYFARGKDTAANGIYAQKLDSQDKKLLLATNEPTRAEYANGYFLYVKEKNLMARSFDVNKLEFTGDAISIAQDLGFDGSYYSFSVSPVGILSFSNINLLNTQLAWIGRDGKTIANIGPPNPCIEPSFSPNEEKISVGCVDTRVGITNLWIVDIAKQLLSRFTFDAHNNYGSVWSADGNWIAFSSSRAGVFDLYYKNARGTGSDQTLYQSKEAKFTDDWSKDGKYIIFESENEKTHYDLWTITFPGEKAQPYVQTPANEAHAEFSPDGKFVAYASDETGRPEIYVRPFPDASAGKWQVSTAGGDQPTWRADGKEMYYLSLDGKIISVEIQTENGFQAGVPVPLFTTGITPSGLVGADRNQYLVSADGKKFLVNALPEGAYYSPIQLIFNWTRMMDQK